MELGGFFSAYPARGIVLPPAFYLSYCAILFILAVTTLFDAEDCLLEEISLVGRAIDSSFLRLFEQ